MMIIYRSDNILETFESNIRAWKIILLDGERYSRCDRKVTTFVFIQNPCEHGWRIEVGDAVTFDYAPS